MEKQAFEVTGTFRIGGEWHPYTKVLTAPNEQQAIERVYTLFGSKHRLKRFQITVDAVQIHQEE